MLPHVNETPRLAHETLEAINTLLEADQGARFRELQRFTFPLVEDAYDSNQDPFRSHLGASILGRRCSRSVWYSFRWTKVQQHEGRILRLFNRGHLEEARFHALLLLIGCKVYTHKEDGQQYRASPEENPHQGGSIDMVAVGIPEMPTTPVLAEAKTHGEKSFIKLKSEGLYYSKFEHYVQMQLYMGELALDYGLYMAVSKNTDELYMEIVEFDLECFHRFNERGLELTYADEAPPRISSNPGWFECKFCDFHSVCHLGKEPNKSCRTCRWSTPTKDGKWICENEASPFHFVAVGNRRTLGKQRQRYGCDYYDENPTIRGIV